MYFIVYVKDRVIFCGWLGDVGGWLLILGVLLYLIRRMVEVRGFGLRSFFYLNYCFLRCFEV